MDKEKARMERKQYLARRRQNLIHGENNSNVQTDLSSRKRKSNISTSTAVEHAQSQDPESSTAAPRRGRPRVK
ncbi:hypothetical protein CASFOL_014512 [Castilleja foliolosa]|uniref:IBB domain-containing protein n=1 Tax=Castilleja foliolosa TaxID=1961234 RepID=A0ABD3DQR0_9LAMI